MGILFHFFLSEGGFLDRGEELLPFSPVLPARAPPYADEEIEPERSTSPLYAVPPYTEAQVSGQKLSHAFLYVWVSLACCCASVMEQHSCLKSR